ncbi:MAG: hypothetical protein IPF85_21790 [Anaerolineae bacterium]|nr:hypothetical protein [Anaerolineae bacterium]
MSNVVFTDTLPLEVRYVSQPKPLAWTAPMMARPGAAF